ncbi:MAG: SLC13 family permease [Methanolobus sp.]|uniref:SLC13 family permease n=1 Tax=Methanolobus sp. TaxID=1874737 RepID=UPI0027310D90|nr:SLC13 family permease [Methanolobus sp.]MDP2218294.1 SLC13 family permease [Methanolobus sp.]
MMLPVIILALVFLLTAVRQVGNIRLGIWQIMSLGALGVLVTGNISIPNAIHSINLDVMLFLFGMFAIGQALEMSGYMSHLSYRFFKNAGTVDAVILYVLFGMGLASAFLMNDTLAIIGTPVMLLLAREHNIDPKVLLLALAFAVTTGSVISPIGNPQNLLIALGGNVENPFITFVRYLLLPTVVNLLITYLLLKIFYKKHFSPVPLDHSAPKITDHILARWSKISLFLVIVLVAAKIAVTTAGIPFNFRLTYIALISALPVLVLSSRRKEIIAKMDWHTLVFFAAMFILMESVWDSGFFQNMIGAPGADINSVPMILGISVFLSQFISNVPLVALYLPILSQADITVVQMMALAAGSTIAGNLSILGAASNVIIIENAEKKGNITLKFTEFAMIGVPLTIIQVCVYWLFLSA